jgi:hypothetical protein
MKNFDLIHQIRKKYQVLLPYLNEKPVEFGPPLSRCLFKGKAVSVLSLRPQVCLARLFLLE